MSTVPMEGANTGNPEVRCLKPRQMVVLSGHKPGRQWPYNGHWRNYTVASRD